MQVLFVLRSELPILHEGHPSIYCIVSISHWPLASSADSNTTDAVANAQWIQVTFHQKIEFGCPEQGAADDTETNISIGG